MALYEQSGNDIQNNWAARTSNNCDITVYSNNGTQWTGIYEDDASGTDATEGTLFHVNGTDVRTYIAQAGSTGGGSPPVGVISVGGVGISTQIP